MERKSGSLWKFETQNWDFVGNIEGTSEAVFLEEAIHCFSDHWSH